MEEIESKILKIIYMLENDYQEVVEKSGALAGVDIHDEIDRWLRTLSIISQGKDK